MKRISVHERLQPSLLDRLTDDKPAQPIEPRDNKFLSVDELRACVMRDLENLMNTVCHRDETFEDFPLTSQSVVNYGIPELAGMQITSSDIGEIEQRVTDAIKAFEPRINPDTLEVRALTSFEDSRQNALMFEIEGEMWAYPVPLQMLLRTHLDLDTGDATISDEQ